MNFSISKKDFSSTLSKSKIFLYSNIKLFYCPGNQKKIGFIVSRKFGSSVKRNLFKRRLRCHFLNHPDFKKRHLSIIIKPLNSKKINFSYLFTNFSNYLNLY